MSRKRIERRKTNNPTTPLKLMANADSLLFPITSLLLILLFSSNPALSQTITASEYREGVSWREDNVKSELAEYQEAQSDLQNLESEIQAKEAEFARAEAAFTAAEKANDTDAMFDAFSEIGSASLDLIFLREKYALSSQIFENSEDALQMNEIWLEQYKNDYEAQSDPFFIRDNIARCARTRCSPGSFLRDTRFTTFQPVVLEMVGVHHAYALGLTGDGVRVGIEDDIVNFTLPEFAERISYEGATLTYPVPYGDNLFSEAKRCQREEVSTPDCVIFPNLNFEDNFEKLSVRTTVGTVGWPQPGQNWFLHDDTLPEGDFRRWVKIPYGSTDLHGTAVASVAAGRDFGVAPGATIIPIAKDFSADGQFDQRSAETSLLRFIANLSAQDRRFIDAELAEEIKADYEHFDVINRSFGIGVFDPISINAVLNDPTQWWGEQFRSILPETWRAFMQTGRHPDERTVVVYATGNSTEEFGGLGSQLPYHETHVRGHQLAVMALDHTGSHADYTNFCGPLPGNWDANRWGRHFCLAAPGMVNTAGSGGPGYIAHELQGTSFAAPVVTGAIALLMERFRGQLGNTEIVKRLVNTANNTGRYAQLEIYGAGLLDLEAALRPVGEVRTGTQNLLSQSAATAIMVPTAFGNLGKKLSGKGIEVASVDALGAPFWSSPEQFITTAWDDPWGTGSVFSAFGNQYLRLNGGPWSSNALIQHHFMQPPGLSGFGALEESLVRRPHLGFTPNTFVGPVSVNGIQLLTGFRKAGLEKAPVRGLRWGFLSDAQSWQGARSFGAFGDRISSVTAWVGHRMQVDLGRRWQLNASASLVAAQPQLDAGTMLEIEPHLLSTWELGLLHRFGEQSKGLSQITLSQPLRAEAGKGRFSYLSGVHDGIPVYEQERFSLTPSSRELQLAWHVMAPLAGGQMMLEVAHAMNAGHQPGQERSRIGLGWWLSW